MSHLVVCVLHYASSQDGFSTNKWDSDGRPETSVEDVVDPVLRLDEQLLQFVLGNVGFGRGVETSEYDRGNCIAGFCPGEKVVRRFTECSANFQESTERAENFGVGVNTGDDIIDEFGERMRQSDGDFLDNGGGISIGD